jgi:hypothetical protein
LEGPGIAAASKRGKLGAKAVLFEAFPDLQVSDHVFISISSASIFQGEARKGKLRATFTALSERRGTPQRAPFVYGNLRGK